MQTNRTIEQEQADFDAMLDALLPEHEGKFVLFKDGQPVEFFASHPEAYSEGLRRFGLDSVFLVAEVAKALPQPISFAWDAGVMFG